MINGQKAALVCGAGGFIGSHMVKRLKKEGYWVRGADVKYPDFSISEADEFMIGDLTDQSFAEDVTNKLFDEITSELTSKGQIFETRDVTNDKGVSYKEYVSFPENLKGYFDFGLLHGDKEFLVYESERFTFNETIFSPIFIASVAPPYSAALKSRFSPSTRT